jgi:hypothetical protein
MTIAERLQDGNGEIIDEDSSFQDSDNLLSVDSDSTDEDSSFQDSDDLLSVDSDNTDDTISLRENIPDLSAGDILLNDCGGHKYGSGGEESIAICTQRRQHMENGHPFYPWKNENELWISSLIYTEMKVSEAAANKLLKGVSDGKLKIDGVRIDTMKQIHSILDAAEYVPVCIQCY